MKLKVYDINRACPKCGNVGTSNHYHTNKSLYTAPIGIRCSFPQNLPRCEHIDRKCRNCGYTWAELCIDHARAAMR